MLKTDPLGVYMGIETGDLIEITRFDESTGLSIEYRVVL
jgi:DNA-directed RNA polymerase subunit H (RpoH/RPB5)